MRDLWRTTRNYSILPGETFSQRSNAYGLARSRETLGTFRFAFDCLFFPCRTFLFPRFFYETSIKAVSAMEFHVGRKMVAELFIQRELFRSQVSRIKPSFYTAINFSAVYPDTICYRQLLKHGLAFKYTCFLIPLVSPIISSTQYMTHYIRLFEKCLSFTDASLYKHETWFIERCDLYLDRTKWTIGNWIKW